MPRCQSGCASVAMKESNCTARERETLAIREERQTWDALKSFDWTCIEFGAWPTPSKNPLRLFSFSKENVFF